MTVGDDPQETKLLRGIACRGPATPIVILPLDVLRLGIGYGQAPRAELRLINSDRGEGAKC